MSNAAYLEFLRSKVKLAEQFGFDVADSDINPLLKPHQRDIVRWMIRMGRCACFAAFGLGKSVIQLEVVRLILVRVGGLALVVIPLGVRQEFMRDASMLGIRVKFIRRIEEADDPSVIYMTNYETIRDGKLDPRLFTVASLDEAAILRGFGGTKTFREFMALFAGDRKAMDARTIGDAIQINLNSLRELAADYVFLFADTAQIVLKANDDLVMLVKSRITEHNVAEHKKIADAAAKLVADAKLAADQEEAKAKTTAPAPATTPALGQVLHAAAPAAIANALAPIKCDGNHGGPRCADPGCWNDTPAVVDNGATMKLGEICSILKFNVTAEFLASLGFSHTTEKNAKLFRQCDFPAICAALERHVNAVAVQFLDTRKAA